MAKPKQCAHCKKPATIHLTQIVGGEIRKVDLCESCHLKDSLAADFDLEPFAKLAEGVVEAHGASGESHVCPSCGCDDDHLRRTGRFGCPECYRAFESVVPDLLGRIHPGLSHEGKAPRRGTARRTCGRKRAELRRELESAVREERFEDAAVYRDRIRRFETQERNADAAED
ncbi:MAG: UvrB/UvrC motif-containing protein [Puniceicoccaceae bacterium]